MRAESNARTYARHLPLVPVEGRGVMIRDVSGRWFYDCLAGAGAASLGWNHEVVSEAIQRVLSSGVPWLTLDLPTPIRDAFMEELLRAMPAELARDGVIHLCGPGGANAIEAALVVAEAATGASEHVAMQGGFHGCSRGARSISGSLRTGRQDASDRCHFLPFPQRYRCPHGVGGDEGVRLSQRAAERLFSGAGRPAGGFASIVVECVQGEAGSLPAPAAFVQTLRACASEHGIPLIADEVQAGVCRTGAMWSFEHSGVVPDIVVASKGLGGGVPIAVIVMKSALNVWDAGAFTGTFRGNAMAFAASTAVLQFIRDQDLCRAVDARGAQLMSGLERIGMRTGMIGEVRGKGLMIGVEIVERDSEADPRGVRPASRRGARQLQRACFDEGLIVEVGGRDDNVIRFLPPLTVSAAEIEAIVELFGRAVSRSEEGYA